MTTQEAIDILYKSVPEAISENYELPALIGRAKEAIEKQIPKEPLKIKAGKDVNLGAAIFKAGSTVYKCPHCESFILCSSKYCNKCGQALDWRDEK